MVSQEPAKDVADAPQDSRRPITPQCTPAVIEGTQASFRQRRRGSQNLAIAERDLKTALGICSTDDAAPLLKEQLRVTQEERAESSLQVAKFYLRPSLDGKIRKNAALPRLKDIRERYPEYSKLDEVIWLLGNLTFEEKDIDEAAKYYQQLIKDFPSSQYANLSLQQIAIIESMKAGTKAPND